MKLAESDTSFNIKLYVCCMMISHVYLVSRSCSDNCQKAPVNNISSSVNMFKNKCDSYMARAGYTYVEQLLFLEIIIIPHHNYLFIHLF